MAIKLIYIGHGDAFIGVPARDLTDEDLVNRAEQWAEYGITEKLLISSGLYAPVETKKKRGAESAATPLNGVKEGE